MTTSSAPIVREILPPPSERKTAFGWLRKNLFNGWGNSLLTVVSVIVIVAILRPFLSWAFGTAEWAVIPANWNLLMRGQYPAEEVWRLWACLYLLGAVVGLSWGVWGRNARGTTIVVFALPLLLMLLPWLSMAARVNLLVVEALALLFYAIGYARPHGIERITTIAIIAYFPLVILLVRGLGITDLTPVIQSNLWGGLLLSLLLSAVGIVFSFPLGVLLALGRQSKLPAIRYLSVIYIEFIRGVPLISLLFMAQVMLQIFLPAAHAAYRPCRTRDGGHHALLCRLYRRKCARRPAVDPEWSIRGRPCTGAQRFPDHDAHHSAPGHCGRDPGAGRSVYRPLQGYVAGCAWSACSICWASPASSCPIPDWLGTQQEVYLVVGAIYWIFSYAMSYTSRKLEVSLGTGQRN